MYFTIIIGIRLSWSKQHIVLITNTLVSLILNIILSLYYIIIHIFFSVHILLVIYFLYYVFCIDGTSVLPFSFYYSRIKYEVDWETSHAQIRLKIVIFTSKFTYKINQTKNYFRRTSVNSFELCIRIMKFGIVPTIYTVSINIII